MDFRYSLYDALVSINVPSDKARAVVDAMERDMGTTLATKHDLQPLASREDMLLFRQELQQLRHEMKGMATRDEVQQLRQQVELQGQRLDGLRVELRKDMEALQLKLTVRLGGMIVAGFGLMIAAMSAAVAWLRTAGL